MRVDVVTIFPSMFDEVLSTSMLGIAQDKGLLEVHIHDLRDWTHDFHRSVDDAPYGGGPGMVMKAQPIIEAIESVRRLDERDPEVVFLAPVGTPLKQAVVRELSHLERMILVCGRYEGFDERVFAYADRIISIGDYVLTGGELAALVIIDAVTRLIPGTLGHEQSAQDESFSEGLLEYPHYTRPSSFRGEEVPAILLSGNHRQIDMWRREQSRERTRTLRPDLWEGKMDVL